MNVRDLLVAGCIAVAAVGAHAHAFLDHAEPRVGSQVASAPAEVKLWFTEPLEGAFSTATVMDANGQRMDRADAYVDASDKALMHVGVQKLAPGTYTVRWRVVSVDTHVTQGDFVFRVGG